MVWRYLTTIDGLRNSGLDYLACTTTTRRVVNGRKDGTLSNIFIVDQAFPEQTGTPHVDGYLIYMGGDTPNPDTNPVTASQYSLLAAIEGPYRLPAWVQSFPSLANGTNDGNVAISWLKSHQAPNGIVVVLDLETAVDPLYVNAFGATLHSHGYRVWPYGSRNTLFQNPVLDGYFLADPTGVPHIYAGTVATQYLAEGGYDESEIDSTYVWKVGGTVPPPPPPPPPPPKEVLVTVVVPELNEGMTNPSVKAVQALLNLAGHGPLAEDGIFGPNTHNAVVSYQGQMRLTADGVVGTHTWGALCGYPQ